MLRICLLLSVSMSCLSLNAGTTEIRLPKELDVKTARDNSANLAFQNLCNDYLELLDKHQKLFHKLIGINGMNGTATAEEAKIIKGMAAWDAVVKLPDSPSPSMPIPPSTPPQHTEIVNHIYRLVSSTYQKAVSSLPPSAASSFTPAGGPVISRTAPPPPAPPPPPFGKAAPQLGANGKPVLAPPGGAPPPPPPPAPKGAVTPAAPKASSPVDNSQAAAGMIDFDEMKTFKLRRVTPITAAAIPAAAATPVAIPVNFKSLTFDQFTIDKFHDKILPDGKSAPIATAALGLNKGKCIKVKGNLPFRKGQQAYLDSYILYRDGMPVIDDNDDDVEFKLNDAKMLGEFFTYELSKLADKSKYNELTSKNATLDEFYLAYQATLKLKTPTAPLPVVAVSPVSPMTQSTPNAVPATAQPFPVSTLPLAKMVDNPAKEWIDQAKLLASSLAGDPAVALIGKDRVSEVEKAIIVAFLSNKRENIKKECLASGKRGVDFNTFANRLM